MVDFSALLIIISSIRYNRDIANGAQNIGVLRYFRTIGDIFMSLFAHRSTRRYSWILPLIASLGAWGGTLFLVLDREPTEHMQAAVPLAEELVSEPDAPPLSPIEYRNVALSYRNKGDTTFNYLASPEARGDVLAFYSALIHSEEIATIILQEAERYGLSPSLAVALAWEESRFVPTAVNRNRTSIDRGLFQLNNRSFPQLAEEDFFDLETNVKHGLAHLKWCLDHAGNEVSGLAMYNAGTTRVRKNTTPQKTLNYVHRILSFKDGIDELFEEEMRHAWYLMADGSVRSVAPVQVELVATVRERPKGIFRYRDID